MAVGALQAALGVCTRDRSREPPGGQLRREGEAEKQASRVVQQARGSTTERRGCNKEKEEERGGGQDESEKGRAGAPGAPGAAGRRRQRAGEADRQQPGACAPRPERPRRPTGSPRRPDEVTDIDRRGPRPELRTPRGRCPALAARSLSAPAPLPALNGSVIDWPRVLFSPRAAGARDRLISIFPAAAPRSDPPAPGWPAGREFTFGLTRSGS